MVSGYLGGKYVEGNVTVVIPFCLYWFMKGRRVFIALNNKDDNFDSENFAVQRSRRG